MQDCVIYECGNNNNPIEYNPNTWYCGKYLKGVYTLEYCPPEVTNDEIKDR